MKFDLVFATKLTLGFETFGSIYRPFYCLPWSLWKEYGRSRYVKLTLSYWNCTDCLVFLLQSP